MSLIPVEDVSLSLCKRTLVCVCQGVTAEHVTIKVKHLRLSAVPATHTPH